MTRTTTITKSRVPRAPRFAERLYPVIMAGAMLASIPALVLFVLAQRYIIEGVSRSGLKG